MKTIKLLMAFIGLAFLSIAYADDTDIYLDADGARANPPYLMLMIDFTPDTGRSYCKPLTGCVPNFTESSFGKLCSLYASKSGVNPAYTESACQLLFRQVKEGGLTTQSTTGL